MEMPRQSVLTSERRAIDRLGISVLCMGDVDFPQPLVAVPDPPIALFVRGCLSALLMPLSVAVVGSRRGSTSGGEFARALSADLGRAGIVVVSGLALGIDGSAHRGALDAGAVTVAVMGGGHIDIYPPSHKGLAFEIAEASGAVVSEYPPSSAPMRGNFPERNRIISGLTAGVVVVEAAARSGTLITARLALEQGREVMAVPGPVFDGKHGGCHKLIKQGAALVEGASDVLEVFGLESSAPSEPDVPSDPKLSRVLTAVPYTVAPLQDIVASLAMPVHEVLGSLVELEIEGFVEMYRGGYIRRPRTNRDRR